MDTSSGQRRLRRPGAGMCGSDPSSARGRGNRRLQTVTIGLGLVLVQPSIVRGQVGPPAGALHSTLEDRVRPAWVALPDAGGVEVPDGVAVAPLNTMVLSRKEPREAVLVGAFRNRGRALSGVRVNLTLRSSEGQPIGEAITSLVPCVDVAPGGLLPFRFPLVARETLAEAPTAYRLSLQESDGPASAPVALDRLTARRRGDRGGTIGGRLVGVRPERLAASPRTLTVVLKDARGEVVDVIVGEWRVESPASGDTAAFVLGTDWPPPRGVASAEAWLGAGPTGR